MAKILMVNLPFAGHTNPTLPLAAELTRRGHEVGYINAPEFRHKIEATGARFIPFENYPDNPTQQQKKTRCFLAAWQTLNNHAAGYDLLLYEMLFYPAIHAARRLGIPCVRQFSQPAWNPRALTVMKQYAPLFLPSARIIDRQMMNRPTARAMGLTRIDMVTSVVHDLPDLNLVYVPEVLQPMLESFDESYHFILPTLPKPEPNGLPDYATLPRPLVYISMGSIMSSRIFCKRCIKAFGGKSMTVVLATARIDPASLGPIPANMHLYSHAPQLALLQHADLFITHCGMNSVNEGLANGVPMLALPVMNDQPVNAGQLESLGAGLRMRAFPTTAKILYRNAVTVLESGEIRAAAKRAQQQVLQGPGAADAALLVETLL